MDFGGFNWGLLKFVGPIVLLLALAWAMLRNRAAGASRAETEAGTRRVYAEEDRREGGEADRAP